MSVDKGLNTNDIPNKLYKYYGNIEYVTQSLRHKGIYMDNPINFNDPFDEMYTVFHLGSAKYKTWVTFQEIINYYLSNSEYIEKYWGEIDFNTISSKIFCGQYDWIIDLDTAVSEFIKISGFNKIPKDTIISEILKKRTYSHININDEINRISCFCDSKNSIPMWAYYGKNHGGICVEYDTTLLDDSIRCAIKPVNYSSHRNSDCIHFCKSDEWKNEQEWRIIKCKDDEKIDEESYYPFDCVSGIYFGERFQFTDTIIKKEKWSCPNEFASNTYNMYCDLISEIKKQNNEIVLYKADTDLKDYKLVFTPFYTYKGNKADEI